MRQRLWAKTMMHKPNLDDQIHAARGSVSSRFVLSFARGCKRMVLCSVTGVMVVLSGCATNPPQAVHQTVPDSRASVGEVAVLADRTLRNMGYEVVDNNIYTGFVHARRRVANDPFGRSTSLKVTINHDQSGYKGLSVQAESCPGCLHEGHLDPNWLARSFIAEFGREAAAGKWHAGQSAPASIVPSAQPAFDKDWQQILDRHGFEQPKAPEPPDQNAVPEPPIQKAVPVAARPEPGITIGDVRTLPETVKPGEPFAVEITFTAHDGADKPGELTVSFSYAIEIGGAILFERAAESVKSPRGRPFQIVKNLTATKEKGLYTIRVKLVAGNLTAEGTSSLNVK